VNKAHIHHFWVFIMVIFCLILKRFSLVFSNKISALSLLLSLDFVVILCNDLGTSFLEVLL